MKHSLYIILLILSCFAGEECEATHIFGGELLYQHQSGNTYKLTLTLYGDCSGGAFGNLNFSTPSIYIYDGHKLTDTISLSLEPNVTEVSPVCEKDLDSTTCKGGSLPGVTRFIYSGFYSLPTQSTDWRFVFTGYMGFFNNQDNLAGRSGAITNIAGSGQSDMYLVAELNNAGSDNNSPRYTTIPTPFYCNNTHQQYNQGAGDPDNDSLVFSLTTALEKGAPVQYIAPYTAGSPLATSGFSFDSLNGQMTFSPNLVQDALVVTLVQEYRNGVLVGTSMREMTFVILPNCSNNPPSATLDSNSVAGAVYLGNDILNICEGTPDISFKASVTDPDQDSVMVSISNLPAGATASVTNNNTPHPVLNFSWNASIIQAGIYNVYVTSKDNGCPLSSNQTIALTLKVLKPPTATYSVINPTRCLYKQHAALTITNGTIPRLVTISKSNVVLKTYFDTTGYIDGLFDVGTYDVKIESPFLLCGNTYQFTVADSGQYPYHPFFTSQDYCIHDIPQPLSASSGGFGTIKWHNLDGTSFDGPPIFSTDAVGEFQWLVSDSFKTCESRRDTITVRIHPQPFAQILNTATTVCIGDLIYLQASGGVKYAWLPEDKISLTKDSLVYTRVTEPTTYSAIAFSEFGCKDTASLTYTDIQPCCTFSYPTAFTPNGDHKNDGFRAILYGNEEYYHINIYNRWGQKVFHSDDVKEYWDGNFGGRACDIGTYYYFVQAKCYSGHVEEQRGEITLIR